MPSKFLFSVLLSLVSAFLIVVADTQSAKADCRPPDCFVSGRGGDSGWPKVPPAELNEVEERIQNGNASIDDYLKSGMGHLQHSSESFKFAERRFTTAFQLAEQAQDLERQAIAQASLGALYSAFKKYRESVPYYERAKQLYIQAGNLKRAKEVEQRIAEVSQPQPNSTQ